MAKTTATKEFIKQRQKLQQAGATKQIEKVSQAWMDSQMGGAIGLQPTSHGESRADVEKWEAGSRYRLVTQLVSTEPMHRIFLFVGSHAEVDAWLDRQRGRKWVAKDSDSTVHHVEVSEALHTPQLALSGDTVDRRLLGGLSEDLWKALNLPSGGREKAETITTADIETGEIDDVVLECTTDDEVAICLLDVATMAYEGKVSGIPSRIALLAGDAKVVSGQELSRHLSDVGSTDELITFDDPDDLRQLLRLDCWEDWQLFLHPRQRDLVHREYGGPARVRGVSGSGKTCVAVHRARMLSEKYRLPVLLVTLTRSASNLLESLKDALCGKGSRIGRRIRAATMAQVATAFLGEFDSLWFDEREQAGRSLVERLYADAVQSSDLLSVLAHEPALGRLRAGIALNAYARAEMEYVRTAFTLADRDGYLEAKRVGRRLPLGREARRVVLKAVAEYEVALGAAKGIDHEMLVLRALDAVTQRVDWPALVHMDEFPYPLSRCVIVDESQDMTENELRLVARVVPEMNDAVFLVGDGAQKVFNRGFSFTRAGIEVKGRSTVLRKNYRNTRQILEAAYPLVTQFVNESAEESSQYIEGSPDYSEREGVRPTVTRLKNEEAEAQWIVGKVSWYVEQHQLTPSSICVVSPAPSLRAAVVKALGDAGISSVELKSSRLSDDPDSVRVTTVESAKGHEFPVVFLCGLAEGFLPTVAHSRSDDLWLEAARMYVAMTRARDWLHLTYADSYGSGSCSPSRFLGTVEGYCDVEDGPIVGHE